ncbi:MAG: hypothetical protein Q9217_001837 [Psora testacea]
MQCYAELNPPTAVTQSLCLPFLSSTANNLIVVKTSLLQIFSLKSIITTADQPASRAEALSSNGAVNAHGQGSTATRLERVQTTKLILVAQYDLAGTVTSIARVKVQKSKSGGEALLVALRDAKLSLVEWDPECYGISTISIHYYEREDIFSIPWEPDRAQCSNLLSVDPSNRCAVFKFGARHLAILPFHQPGDDIAMEDYETELDGERAERKESIAKIEHSPDSKDATPYAASFVLSLLALDPTLTHPIHLSFLYEYREPTFGILSSQNASSTALLNDRRDNVSYAVYNLDLGQRASTTVLSVNNLPYDLFKIIPLSRIVGGALLVGGNELIHVDQSGKTNGVAVNPMAKQCTSFALADQSELKIKLEGSVIKQLGIDNPDLLILQPDGGLSILTFTIDGRSVSGLGIRPVDPSDNPLLAGASCASSIGRGRMFIGSEDADSVVMGWSRASDRLKRQRSRRDVTADNDEFADLDDIEIEDDDDLYADDKPEDKAQSTTAILSAPGSGNDYKFRVHDSLLNTGPMSDVAFGIFPVPGPTSAEPSQPKHELMVTSGRGKAGALTSFRSDLEPLVVQQYTCPFAQAVWTVCAKNSAEASNGDALDNYLIAAIDNPNGQRKSKAFAVGADDLVEVENTDFEPDAGGTIDAGTLNGGTRIVQVLANEVRTFDADFGLAQIFPLLDEDSDTGSRVTRASFADPYVLLNKDDKSVTILTADENGDLDEVEQGEKLKDTQWLSSSLYEDSNDVLRLDYGSDDDEEASNVLMFLLSATGGLQVCAILLPSKGIVTAAQLPLHSSYNTGWATHRIPLNSEANSLSYHSPSQTYILSTLSKTPFKLPEDEYHRTFPPENEPFLPEIEQSTLKLFDRKSCTVVDRHTLDQTEVVTCIETIFLEVSENTHERQELVCVGTALIRGEDLPSLGRIYVFAIIDVVPEPDRPETGRAFKLICKEEVKGAVTALSGIGTQGFLLVAQGQKCMVRGLKEDGSLLPVAFMDMQCYVSAAKELPGTGLCLMGDAIKGVWFTGYTVSLLFFLSTSA